MLPSFTKWQKGKTTGFLKSCRFGRDNRIWTCGLIVPNDARYQAALYPVPEKNKKPNINAGFHSRRSGKWWREMDSNHRSRRQQIYSLPPLAAREFSHIQFTLNKPVWSWWTDEAFPYGKSSVLGHRTYCAVPPSHFGTKNNYQLFFLRASPS